MDEDPDPDTHLDVLSVLSLVFGGLLAVPFLMMLTFMAGFAAPFMGGMGRLGTAMMGLMVLAMLAAVALLLATGIGLRMRAPWARTVGFATCALALFNVPIGTAYGLYGFWVLTRPGVEAELSAGRSPA